MRRLALLVLLVLVETTVVIGPAGAITFGKPDGNLHPNVGAVLADYDEESPGPDILCSGTLIDADVFLTAGHCTSFLEGEEISEVWVTFEPEYDEDDASPSGVFAGTYVDGIRRYALQSYLSLQASWLNLSMNPSTGDGGTCYGDSGGPHFLGGVDSNLIVSITVTGDAMCRATDKTYRIDTASARAFLDDFVALP
jgi:secreted trypsin-like serine protease